jgi:hypothetical protein
MAFGGLTNDSSDGDNAEINMIPLIDVMLVLLVIFIITAPMMTHAVKVDLPQASSQPNAVKPETIQLSIQADGTVYWNAEVSRRCRVANTHGRRRAADAAAGNPPARRRRPRLSPCRADHGRCGARRAGQAGFRHRSAHHKFIDTGRRSSVLPTSQPAACLASSQPDFSDARSLYMNLHHSVPQQSSTSPCLAGHGRHGSISLPAHAIAAQIELPRIDVIAGGEEAIAKQPGSVSIVNKEQLERIQPLSTEDALRKVPGVYIKGEEETAVVANIGIRGLNAADYKTLILEDGVPIAPGLFVGNGRYYNPRIQRMDEIEVLKGAAAALRPQHHRRRHQLQDQGPHRRLRRLGPRRHAQLSRSHPRSGRLDAFGRSPGRPVLHPRVERRLPGQGFRHAGPDGQGRHGAG